MPTNEELVKRYQDGDYFALNELTEHNMKLIHYIANKYSTDCSFIDTEDLIQEGWTGFYRAIETYQADHPSKAAFSTWAVYWIRQAITRYLSQRVPKEESSLHEPAGGDGDTLKIDLLEDKDDNSFHEMWHRLEVRELHKELDEAMNKYLSLKHREILQMHYGWNGLKEMIFEEISKLYGVSIEAVRQQHNKALKKLRQTKWARLRAADMRTEATVKARYQDPLAALMAKYKQYGHVTVEDLIYEGGEKNYGRNAL